jgi:hypothetical protein
MPLTKGLQREYSRSIRQDVRSLNDLQGALHEIMSKVIEGQFSMNSLWNRDRVVSYLKSVKQELISLPHDSGRSLLMSASTIAVALSVAWNEPELLLISICHIRLQFLECEVFLSSSMWELFLASVFGHVTIATPSVRTFQHAAVALYAAFADEEALTTILSATPGASDDLIVPCSLIIAGDMYGLLLWCRSAHCSIQTIVDHLAHHTLKRRFEHEQLGNAFRPQISLDATMPLPAGMRERLRYVQP